MVNKRRKAEDRLVYDASIELLRDKIRATGGIMRWDADNLGWEIGSGAGRKL